MIRINLLAAERDKSKKKAVTLGTAGQKLTIGCSAILLLSGLGSAGVWFRSYLKRDEKAQSIALRDRVLALARR